MKFLGAKWRQIKTFINIQRLQVLNEYKKYSNIANLLKTIQDYHSITTDSYPYLFTLVKQNNKEAFQVIFDRLPYKDELYRDNQNDLQVNLLMFAYLQSNLPFAQYLQSKGFKADQPNNLGMTILHLAVIYQHRQTLLHLFSQNTNPDAQDSFGNTPLHYACRAGSLQYIQLLLLANSNHLKNKAHQYPIHLAIESLSFEAVLALKDRLFNPTNEYLALGHHDYSNQYHELHTMHSAAKTNMVAVMKEIYAHDHKLINVEDDHLFTPLHYAATFEAEEAVKFLLEKPGILVSKKDKRRNTPLHYAFIRENIDIIKMLVKSKAELDEENDEYMAPVDYGINSNSKEIHMFLQEIRQRSQKLKDWRNFKN